MNKFSGLITCDKCGWKYRFKKQRNKYTYVCSGASTKGKEFCDLNKVEEDDLLFYIKGYFKIKKKEFDVDEIKKITIYPNKDIIIYYKSGEGTIINSNKYMHLDNMNKELK